MALRSTKIATVLALGIGLFGSSIAMADGFAGGYLAGRQAMADSDFRAASRHYTRAIVQDPGNSDLIKSALLAYVGQGDVAHALTLARRLEGMDDPDQVANMLLLVDLIKGDDLDSATQMLDDGEVVGPLVDGLARAWIELGQGHMSDALATFEEVAAQPGLQNFGLYHRALALALAGDLEGSNAILRGDSGISIPVTRRGALAHVEILSQLEDNERALALIDRVFGSNSDPSLDTYRDRLRAGETLPLTAARSIQDGIAEVFYSLAGALSGEANDGYTLVYTRLAEELRPDHIDAILLSAQLLENLGQYDLATEAYDRIPRDDPAYLDAELGRAQALALADNTDASIEVLRQLTESFADQSDIHVTLGDTYRRLSRFEEATGAYDQAIAILEDNDAAMWSVYYTRGIALERQDLFERAEKDFRRALEISPDQPQVLNYLGYSFVELQRNLDEALDMIERAVAARPNDGYITDSLGWVLYRRGLYSQAVVQMERAAELVPVDPIVNDHLGDVYWAVGRRREAEFQWNRAMSFEPEEADEIRIRRKLEVGLDVVLEEEGADPIVYANDG